MVEVLPHRALHSITKHLSGILKFICNFHRCNANHVSNIVSLLCINVLDAIIDKKLMQVKPRFYLPFFPIKHAKLITKKN